MKAKIKITTLDYAILGLLRQGPLSGYGIQKIFTETAMGIYSSSPGTLYPALSRMEKTGIIVKSVQKDGKNKFMITDLGTVELKKWLNSPLTKKDIMQNKDILLLRFAFMDGLIDDQKKIEFLLSFKRLCSEYLDELKEYHENDFQEISLVGQLAFEHGIQSYNTTIKWCKSAISALQKNTKNEN